MNLLTSPLRPAPRLAAVAAGLLLAAASALAQYKIVGPDGRVTYTDQPPPAGQKSTAVQGGSGGAGAGTDAFPYETRQAMGRYPVTLYAQKGCNPCDQARSWLKARGIPFSEYSVETPADAEQFKQRFNGVNLPMITMGGQTIKGFSPSELGSYADAAGYPRQARLSGYSWPAPVPLAPATAAGTAPASAPAPSTSPAGPKIDLPPPSKNGIQF